MKTDIYRLERVSAIGHQLLSVVAQEGINQEAIMEGFKLQWMVATPLFDIGEQVNCLSDELIASYADQPWSSIAGLRHRLVHNYEGTNWRMIGAVIEQELPLFIARVDEILQELRSA